MGRLAFNVAVRHPETGYPEVFLADSEPPAWAAELIDNPGAWAQAPQVEALPPVVVEAPLVELPPVEVAPSALPTPMVAVPNRRGRGSSGAAWAAYAASAGVEVAPGADRDEIIAACEAANVPTE